MSEHLYFNGLNGDTGNYLFDPVTTDEVVSYARGGARLERTSKQ